MAIQNSAEYYQSRERQERLMAQTAGSPVIAAIHLELAARYTKLAQKPLRLVENA